MRNNDFETDRGTGAIITALAVLGIIAMATIYMLFPVDRNAGGNDVPHAKMSRTAPEISPQRSE